MLFSWLIVLGAIALIGIAKSGFGGGLGLIVVPLCAIGLAPMGYSPEAVLGLLLPLLMVGDIISVVQYRNEVSWSHIRRLLLPAALGIILGGVLLYILKTQSDPQLVASLIRLEIGVESMLLVALSWWRVRRGVQVKLLPEPARSISTGLFAGISSTLAHAAGPIVAMYLLPLNLDRRLFVGTCAFFFFIANWAKVPVYFQAGLFENVEWRFAVYGAPLVLIGAVFGRWMNKRLSDKLFTRIVLWTTFLLGIYLVIDGTTGVLHRIQD